jgi:two-component system, LuxR family, sensor kinase FixL
MSAETAARMPDDGGRTPAADTDELLLHIREQRRMVALQDTEAALRELAEHIPDVFWVTEPQTGTCLYVNSAYETIWGRTCRSLLERPRSWLEGVHPDDRPRIHAHFEQQAAGQETNVEYRVVRPDGSVRWIHDRGFPVRDAAGRLHRVVGIAKDITQRKLAEGAQRQDLAKLAHVARLTTLGEMAAGLAHELNQPLSAIANFTQGCVRRIRAGTAQPEELLEALEEVAVQTERAGEVIRRMRGFLRSPQPGRASLDLNELIREAARLDRAEMQSRGTRLRFELADSLPEVLGDQAQLEQVLLNLIRNAQEAMAENAPEQRELTLASSRGDGWVKVTVHDTGPELAAAVRVRLLEQFFTTKAQGLGLGLAISRSIIEAHGGRLWAENNAGGTTFSFTLPAGGR